MAVADTGVIRYKDSDPRAKSHESGPEEEILDRLIDLLVKKHGDREVMDNLHKVLEMMRIGSGASAAKDALRIIMEDARLRLEKDRKRWMLPLRAAWSLFRIDPEEREAVIFLLERANDYAAAKEESAVRQTFDKLRQLGG